MLLSFVEDACVQCGLCKATCPEKVITLKPRLDAIEMCADCRVAFVLEQAFDPHGPAGRSIRTTDDYLREHDDQQTREAGRE